MILFVVNDAGPAKYISYILRELDANQYICIASDISSKVFDDFNINYQFCYKNMDLKNIDLIVTGTCLGNGIDKDFVFLGKQNNIKTISIIEHWSLYKKRFQLNDNYIFPDLIFVNDEVARQEAIKDGIDEKLLKVVGNPVLENIKKQSYTLEDNIIWKKKLQIDTSKRIITFISEDYKKDFPKGSKEYLGFDEFDVIDDLLENIIKDDILIIKLHPAEDKTKYDYIKKNKNVKIIVKTDINKLILFSDLVIGMGSMLLLEASFLRDTVYSYRLNEQIGFIGNKNKMTIKLSNKDELKQVLKSNFKRNKILNNNFKNSTKNILNVIQENAL